MGMGNLLLLPERAQSLEEWREKLYFPGGFQEWCIRKSHPTWSFKEQHGLLMYSPRFNDPFMLGNDEQVFNIHLHE